MADTNFFQNADLFNKLPPSYYLNRKNHVGTQPISSIDGLQDILDACTGIFASLAYVNQQDEAYFAASKTYTDIQLGISYSYFIQQDSSLLSYINKFIKSSSTGFGLFWNNGYLDVSVLSTDKEYVDGSLANYIKSSSTGIGLFWNNGLLDVSVLGGGGDVSKGYLDMYFVKSYKTYVSPIGINSYYIPESTHHLGPDFAVYVWEGSEPLYPNVVVDGSGNLTLSWIPGSVTGELKILLIGASGVNSTIDNSVYATIDMLNRYFKESSIGAGFKWNNGKLDVSVNPTNDGSIASTAPFIPYWDGSKYLDSSALYYKGNIGIGFNPITGLGQDPSYRIHIKGPNSTYALAVSSPTGATGFYVYQFDGANMFVNRSVNFGNVSGRATFNDVGTGMVMNIARGTQLYDSYNFGTVLGYYNLTLTSSDGFYMNRYINHSIHGDRFFMGWGAKDNWNINIPRTTGFVGINQYNPKTYLDVSGHVIIDGCLNVTNHRIINIAYPVDPSDAVNKWYVDNSLGSYVKKSGDIMTGDLSINANFYANFANVQALIIRQGNIQLGSIASGSPIIGRDLTEVDNAVAIYGGLLSNPQLLRIYNNYTSVDNFERATLGWYNNQFVITTESSVNNRILNLGNIIYLDPSNRTINVNNIRIQQVATPISSSDAVNKFYVDSSFALKVDVSFGNYYTKTQVDSSFALKTDINASFGNYYTKIQIDSSFYNKAQIDSSFALKTDLSSLKNNIDTSLGLYVKKSGDIMTGDLTINTSLNVTGNIISSGTIRSNGVKYIEMQYIQSEGAVFKTNYDPAGAVRFQFKNGSDNVIAQIYDDGILQNVYYGYNRRGWITPWSGTTGHLELVNNWPSETFGITFSTSANERMRITGNGRISMGGIAVPRAFLDVNGNMRIDGSVYINNQKIYGLATPVNSSDAVNKFYVDSSFALKSYVDASLNNYLLASTDTFTGALTIDGSLIIHGDLYQDGSMYVVHAENLNTQADFIVMREGAVSALPDGSISGILITKPNGANNIVFGAAKDAILRVGWRGDVLEAVATREDNPIDGYFAYWDNSSTMFKTYNLRADVNARLKEASLGTGFKWNGGKLDVSAIGDVTKAYVDGSLAKRDTSINVKIEGAQNIGSGDASIFVGKNGLNLQFKTLIGSGAATVTQTVDTISIGINASFGGEVNTASNIGGDVGLYAQKIAQDLQFKTLRSANNTIIFTNDASHVIIDVSDYISKTRVDACLNNTIDAFSLFYTKIQVDSSFYLGTKVDASFYTKTYIDSSFNQISANFIKSSSTATNASGLWWNGGILSVSTGYTTDDELTAALSLYYTKTYIDSSFGMYYTKTEINASLNNYVRKTGDTMTGTLVMNASINMSNNGIMGLSTPVSSSDAVNKWYVDSSFATYMPTVNASEYFISKYDTDIQLPGNLSIQGRLNMAYGVIINRNTSSNLPAGIANVIIGDRTGNALTTGSYNTMLGDYAGYSDATGSGNVLLGYYAGSQEVGSNKLYIANSSTSSPLIYGQFDSCTLIFNASIGLGISPFTQMTLGGYESISMVTGNTYGFLTHTYDGTDILSLSLNAKRSGSNYVKYGNWPPAEIALIMQGGGSIKSRITFGTNNSAFGNPITRMSINEYGTIGIGNDINSSTYLLDVSGNARFLGNVCIQNVPINSSDAVNKWYVDSSLGLYVQKAGDTMTGALIINSSLFVNNILSIGKINSSIGYSLDVSGNILTNYLTIKSPSAIQAGSLSTDANYTTLYSTKSIIIEPNVSNNGATIIRGYAATGVIINDNNNKNVIIAQGGGSVGIGKTPSQTLDVSGNVAISGALTAATKSFYIDHPTKEGKKLQYGSLEGPEYGVYERGRLSNNNVIQLPEYWSALVDKNSMTINLTSNKPHILFVKKIMEDRIIIGKIGFGKIDCFYTVYGERKDVNKLIIES